MIKMTFWIEMYISAYGSFDNRCLIKKKLFTAFIGLSTFIYKKKNGKIFLYIIIKMPCKLEGFFFSFLLRKNSWMYFFFFFFFFFFFTSNFSSGSYSLSCIFFFFFFLTPIDLWLFSAPFCFWFWNVDLFKN